MNPLGKILEQALRSFEKEGGLEARVVLLWPDVVGPQMARVSEVRALQGDTLVVVTRSSGWSQEFSFQKATILRRFRERLGHDQIKDLRFVVGKVRGSVEPPVEPQLTDEEVRRIELPRLELERIQEATEEADPELAEAIRRALTHEARLRQWHLAHGAKACPQCGAAHHTPHKLCPACRVEKLPGG
jgi:predicted nucleic acid-binding Zn ribbon protein